MTEQQAIKILKEEKSWESDDRKINAFIMGIEALEKQIPKKPINQKYSFFPHSNLLKSKYGECPICNTVQADDEYCQHCGQKLDWS